MFTYVRRTLLAHRTKTILAYIFQSLDHRVPPHVGDIAADRTHSPRIPKLASPECLQKSAENHTLSSVQQLSAVPR